jgi:hypothetical protein
LAGELTTGETMQQLPTIRYDVVYESDDRIRDAGFTNHLRAELAARMNARPIAEFLACQKTLPAGLPKPRRIRPKRFSMDYAYMTTFAKKFQARTPQPDGV